MTGTMTNAATGSDHHHSCVRAIPGTLIVDVVTVICYALRLDLTVTAFLYLIIVVLQTPASSSSQFSIGVTSTATVGPKLD